MVIQEVGLVRLRLQRLGEHLEGFRILVGVAQQLRLGNPHLHLLFARVGRAQVFTRLGKLALLGQDHRIAQARGNELLARLDLRVPLERRGEVLLFLGKLAEREAHAVLVAEPGLQQLRKVGLALVVILQLHGKQADGVEHVGIFGVGCQQRLELLPRLGKLLVEHQQARIAEARLAGRGIALQVPGQPCLRLGRRLGLEELGFEDRREIPVGTQLPRPADGSQCERVVVRGGSGLRYGEVRLRQFGVVPGELAHDAEIR